MKKYPKEGVEKPQNKFEEVGAEFLNEADYEEALDEEYQDSEELEKEEYDLENKMAPDYERYEKDFDYEKEGNERDEDVYEDLVEKGYSEGEAANIVDSVTSKQLREKEYRKGKFEK